MPEKSTDGLAFASVVLTVVPNWEVTEIRQCPDICAGPISKLSKQSAWVPTERAGTPDEKAKIQSVILVLESPHKDEYRGDPLPANGATGRQIRKFASELARSIGVTVDADLVILNAVPYQCSLGKSTALHRSAVFRRVWASGGLEFFLARLRTWYREGDVIVNACTIGGPGKPLRDDVEEGIETAFPSANRARRQHPFSWMTSETVRKQWEKKPSFP